MKEIYSGDWVASLNGEKRNKRTKKLVKNTKEKTQHEIWVILFGFSNEEVKLISKRAKTSIKNKDMDEVFQSLAFILIVILRIQCIKNQNEPIVSNIPHRRLACRQNFHQIF